MSAVIVVYAPAAAKNYPVWLDRLPEHTRVRSGKGLEAALILGNKRSASRICLLVPRDLADLTELASHPERFNGWKVVLELPDESPDALKVARPLAPRFFSFRNESQAYLVEVVKWIYDHSATGEEITQPSLEITKGTATETGEKEIPWIGSKT